MQDAGELLVEDNAEVGKDTGQGEEDEEEAEEEEETEEEECKVEEEEDEEEEEEEPEEEDEEDEEEGFSAPADSDESGEDGGETDSGAVDLECGKSQEEKGASASESADSDDDWDIDAEIDACEAEAAARHSTGLSSGGRESRAGRIAAANLRWDSHTGEEFLSYGCSAQTRTLRCPSLSSSALFVAHCPLERLVQVSRTGCFRHARTTRQCLEGDSCWSAFSPNAVKIT
jgi:hypothetical protein